MISVPTIVDPLIFSKRCWPDVDFYKEQREIIYSVRDNVETYVPAGNGLGKDFVAAFICLWWMCSRRPSRVVTTSVKADQLDDVLWGEIRRFLETSKIKLPLFYNHAKIRQTYNDGTFVPLSELVAQAVNKGESLLGRHLARDIPRTLVVFDECSGVEHAVYEKTTTWAHRILVIGNCFPCPKNHFFRAGVTGGDVPDEEGRLFRKVIRIKAEDSPNIRLAFKQRAEGKKITHEELIPGVVNYRTYMRCRKHWDPIMQCIGLDASWYEGKDIMLFPAEWLNAAETQAQNLGGIKNRRGQAIGVDSAEGGDNSSWAVVDHLGLIDLIRMKTPDTSVIPNQTIALIRQYGVDPTNVLFDIGGGGKEHADRLRVMGFPVRTVGFGESPTSASRFQRRLKTTKERVQEAEGRYAYKNRRAEMYHLLRRKLDSTDNKAVFGLPRKFMDCRERGLREQLGPLPLLYDGEGRIWLPPKHRRNEDDKQETITDLVGYSPDEADSLVLAVYGLYYRGAVTRVGSMI